MVRKEWINLDYQFCHTNEQNERVNATNNKQRIAHKARGAATDKTVNFDAKIGKCENWNRQKERGNWVSIFRVALCWQSVGLLWKVLHEDTFVGRWNVGRRRKNSDSRQFIHVCTCAYRNTIISNVGRRRSTTGNHWNWTLWQILRCRRRRRRSTFASSRNIHKRTLNVFELSSVFS